MYFTKTSNKSLFMIFLALPIMKNIEPRRGILLLTLLILVLNVKEATNLINSIYIEIKKKQHKSKKHWETEYNPTDSMGPSESRTAQAK